jgi:hypothetical protein
MKILERIFLVMLLAGFTLLYMSLPGGLLLTIISTSLFALFYFALGFAIFNRIELKQIFNKSAYQGLNVFKLLVGFLSGYGVSMWLMSLLFLVAEWPGARTIFYSAIGIVVVAFIFGIIAHKSFYSTFQSLFLPRLVVLLILTGVAVNLTPLNRLQRAYKDHPDYIEAVKASRQDPNNQELKERVEWERRKMNGEE